MIRGIIILTVILASAFGFAAEVPRESTKLLYFNHLTIPPGTRIASVRIDIFGARVSALPRIPADWHVHVDIEGAYRTTVSGNCQHGVGGLNRTSDLDGVIAVTAGDWHDVKVEGVICVTRDFDHVDEIRVNRGSVELR